MLSAGIPPLLPVPGPWSLPSRTHGSSMGTGYRWAPHPYLAVSLSEGGGLELGT